MHCLSKIAVRNYRSCTNEAFSLSEYTPLVGYNNGGKSNLLGSIRWLLRPLSLSTTDFNDKQSPVTISGTIGGITPELLANLAETHRNRIEPFCRNGTLGIRRTQVSPGMPANTIVLEIRDPDVSNELSEDAWVKNPTGIDAAIKALFPEPIEIGAMEDATEDIGKYKSSSTIGKLIAEIMEPIEQQHGTEIRQTLDGIKQRLEADGTARAPELNQFDDGANDKLRDIFPGIRIRLHIPTPEIKTLFKDGTIRVFEEGETNGREIGQVGHGAQRSIQMALVRYLAEMKAGANAQLAARTLLLIDEPELYLHPQAIEQVRLALKILVSKGYQVIFATHSPQMIDRADIGNTLIICKTIDRGTYARKRLSDTVSETIVDAPSQVRILFELSNSSKILFSDHVLIVEGSTEEKLLPDIFHRIKGYTLSARKIALVRLDGSGNIAKALRILDAIGIPAKALVDLDYAFRDARKAGFLDEADMDITVCCSYCSQISEKFGFTLADDGFPKANAIMSASEAFAILATHGDIKDNILKIHNKLKEKHVWLWKKGTFEDHLGIDRKGESAWAQCVQDIQQNGCEKAIADYSGIEELVNWIDTY